TRSAAGSWMRGIKSMQDGFNSFCSMLSENSIVAEYAPRAIPWLWLPQPLCREVRHLDADYLLFFSMPGARLGNGSARARRRRRALLAPYRWQAEAQGSIVSSRASRAGGPSTHDRPP